MTQLTAGQLRKAAKLTEKIEELQSELAKILSGFGAVPGKKEKPAKKSARKMSPEARERIAAAQRKRWAAAKKAAKKEASV